jgi:hypothetical protein
MAIARSDLTGFNATTLEELADGLIHFEVERSNVNDNVFASMVFDQYRFQAEFSPCYGTAVSVGFLSLVGINVKPA